MTMTTANVAAPRRRLFRLGGLPWVTWRQHRLALAGVVALLGGFGVFFVVNGVAMHHDYARLGLSRCADLRGPSCSLAVDSFTNAYGGWAQFLPRFLEFVPGAIGLFIGPALVGRELESGTFRFAWTQGTSRMRWVSVKLALVGLTLTVLALAFSALFGWWFGPFHVLSGRMEPGQAYEVEGLVFAARTLFAFTLGALLGTVIRRVVPAMAATAVAWLGAALLSLTSLRPLFAKPLVGNARATPDTAWTISQWFQDAAGHHLSPDRLLEQARVAGAVGSGEQFDAWLANHHISGLASFQPAGRFWHFQMVEAAGYAVVAALLAAATIWLVRRRAA